MAGAFYAPLKALGIETPAEELMRTTGIGTVLYAKRPGDGSAREYAASCRKVLGGLRGGLLAPGDPVTRAQAAVMLQRYQAL